MLQFNSLEIKRRELILLTRLFLLKETQLIGKLENKKMKGMMIASVK